MIYVLALLLIATTPAQAQTCIDIDSRQRLRALQLEAIDEAYKDSVKHLFEIWMRDPAGQPQRARVGLSLATEAYVHARGVVLKWNPLVCNQEPSK
jgi:hypothetical protein